MIFKRVAVNPNRHLDNKDINNIIEIVNSWPRGQKLTWLLIIEKIEKYLHLKKSANALREHKLIYDTYKIKLKGISSKSSEIPIDLKVAHDRIEKLESKLEAYEITISRYDMMFLIMQNNAYSRGLTEEDLFTELQSIDRRN